MTRNETIKILARRAASILADWVGMAGPAKFNNGDPSPAGGMAMALMTLADRGEAPPTDAAQRLENAICETIAERDADTVRRGYKVDGLLFCVSTDYGPDRNLRDLADKAGLRGVHWPWKSALSIGMTYRDGSGSEHVTDSRGSDVVYRLLPDGGWLISRGFWVPNQVLDVCLAAAKAGHPAMTYEAAS